MSKGCSQEIMLPRYFICVVVGTAVPSLKVKELVVSESFTKSSVLVELRDILYSAAPDSNAARNCCICVVVRASKSVSSAYSTS